MKRCKDSMQKRTPCRDKREDDWTRGNEFVFEKGQMK